MAHFCISTISQHESQGLPKDKSWMFMDFPWFSINLELSDRDDFYINSIKSQGLSGNPKSSQNLKREKECVLTTIWSQFLYLRATKEELPVANETANQPAWVRSKYQPAAALQTINFYSHC